MSDMPFRGLKSARKQVVFSAFSGKRDELAKRECCAKRVHPLRMNIHPLAELPVAKRR